MFTGSIPIFCGAVYDDEIFAKVKMAVVCTLFIHELNVGTYLKTTGSLSWMTRSVSVISFQENWNTQILT